MVDGGCGGGGLEQFDAQLAAFEAAQQQRRGERGGGGGGAAANAVAGCVPGQ